MHINIWKMKPNQWFYLYYFYYPFFAYSYVESDIHEAGFIEDNFSDVEMVIMFFSYLLNLFILIGL